ncbi:hypothetical protein C8Q78DRAFT_657974 [Trametes maxima]|nr:hypothetical protein C8Q78DRAFT_657974 [Trametes maxima]
MRARPASRFFSLFWVFRTRGLRTRAIYDGPWAPGPPTRRDSRALPARVQRPRCFAMALASTPSIVARVQRSAFSPLVRLVSSLRFCYPSPYLRVRTSWSNTTSACAFHLRIRNCPHYLVLRLPKVLLRRLDARRRNEYVPGGPALASPSYHSPQPQRARTPAWSNSASCHLNDLSPAARITKHRHRCVVTFLEHSDVLHVAPRSARVAPVPFHWTHGEDGAAPAVRRQRSRVSLANARRSVA